MSKPVRIALAVVVLAVGGFAALYFTAGYRVREKLATLPAQSDAVGRTAAVTGTFRLERQAHGFTASGARFEVDLTKLVSDETRRDNRIRTQGLDSDRFPTATFVSTSPISVPVEPEATLEFRLVLEKETG